MHKIFTAQNLCYDILMRTIVATILILLSCAAQAYTDEEKALISSEYGIDVDAVPVADNKAENQRQEKLIADELEASDVDYYELASRMDRAMREWVRVSALLMERKGKAEWADQFIAEYHLKYSSFYTNLYFFGLEPLGTHEPMSLWVEAAYLAMCATLGMEIVIMLHLDDIHWLNYGLPVALQPGGDRRTDPITEWTEEEYVYETSKNVAGPITYWSIYLICTGMTSGIPGVFACSPIGVVSENLVANRLAPPIAKRIHRRANSN